MTAKKRKRSNPETIGGWPSHPVIPLRSRISAAQKTNEKTREGIKINLKSPPPWEQEKEQ